MRLYFIYKNTSNLDFESIGQLLLTHLAVLKTKLKVENVGKLFRTAQDTLEENEDTFRVDLAPINDTVENGDLANEVLQILGIPSLFYLKEIYVLDFLYIEFIKKIQSNTYEVEPRFATALSTMNSFRLQLLSEKVFHVKLELHHKYNTTYAATGSMLLSSAAEKSSQFNPSNPYNAFSAAIEDKKQFQELLKKRPLNNIKFKLQDNKIILYYTEEQESKIDLTNDTSTCIIPTGSDMAQPCELTIDLTPRIPKENQCNNIPFSNLLSNQFITSIKINLLDMKQEKLKSEQISRKIESMSTAFSQKFTHLLGAMTKSTTMEIIRGVSCTNFGYQLTMEILTDKDYSLDKTSTIEEKIKGSIQPTLDFLDEQKLIRFISLGITIKTTQNDTKTGKYKGKPSSKNYIFDQASNLKSININYIDESKEILSKKPSVLKFMHDAFNMTGITYEYDVLQAPSSEHTDKLEVEVKAYVEEHKEFVSIYNAIVAKDYNQALRKACSAGKFELVLLLYKYNNHSELNLDPNQSSLNGKNCLDYAIESGRSNNLISFLENIGAQSSRVILLSTIEPEHQDSHQNNNKNDPFDDFEEDETDGFSSQFDQFGIHDSFLDDAESVARQMCGSTNKSRKEKNRSTHDPFHKAAPSESSSRFNAADDDLKSQLQSIHNANMQRHVSPYENYHSSSTSNPNTHGIGLFAHSNPSNPQPIRSIAPNNSNSLFGMVGSSSASNINRHWGTGINSNSNPSRQPFIGSQLSHGASGFPDPSSSSLFSGVKEFNSRTKKV